MRSLIITLAILIFAVPASADWLILCPEIPQKPVISLTAVDEKTKEIVERKPTDKELLAEAEYTAKVNNLRLMDKELDKDKPIKGRYVRVIGENGPKCTKDGITYIAHSIPNSQVNGKITIDKAQGLVVDTGGLTWQEWLEKNGYKKQ